MKGKPWTPEEEQRLQQMLQANKSVRVIAKTLGKTRECVRMKIGRLNFEREVVIRQNTRTTTTNLPSELPSIEEVLLKLARALYQLEQAQLDPNETMRLRSIVQTVKVYQELLADFVDYRGIEARVIDLEAKYARLVKDKAKDDSSKPVPAKVEAGPQ